MLNTFNPFFKWSHYSPNSTSAQTLQSSDIDFVSASYLFFGTELEPMEEISNITDFVKTSSYSFIYIKHQSLGNEGHTQVFSFSRQMIF